MLIVILSVLALFLFIKFAPDNVLGWVVLVFSMIGSVFFSLNASNIWNFGFAWLVSITPDDINELQALGMFIAFMMLIFIYALVSLFILLFTGVGIGEMFGDIIYKPIATTAGSFWVFGCIIIWIISFTGLPKVLL